MCKHDAFFSNIIENFFLKKSSNKMFAVLGMHRSGTSCLTGLLEDAGVFLGNVSKHNLHNIKGNQESLQVVHLNNAVLSASGASWDNPPEIAIEWSANHKKKLFHVLSEYDGKTCWAFKDPRTLFTLEGWLDALPKLEFIGTFRHPLAVARSLYKRGQISQDVAIDLWYRYNTKLMDYQKQFDFDIVDFDLPPDEYLLSVSRALNRLGVKHDPSNFKFFDSALRHKLEMKSSTLPPKVENLYLTLQKVAL